MARGACPQCGEPVPFARTQLRRGKRFSCSRCGTGLIVPKGSVALALVLVAALSFLSGRVPFAAIALLLVAAALFEWLLVRVRLSSSPTN